MMDFKEKLAEAKAATETSLDNIKQLRADWICMDDSGNVDILDSMNRFQGIIREIEYSFKNLNDRINYLSDAFYQHTSNGHLPAAPGPAAMKSAIDALGWSQDFNVQPRSIYAGLSEGFVKVGGVRIN